MSKKTTTTKQKKSKVIKGQWTRIRDTLKFPTLKPNANRKNLREYLDADYINQLSEKEKVFLDKFNREYYTADFRHEKPLHKKRQRKEIYRNNNKRNADTTSYLGSYNQLKEVKETDSVCNSTEDSLIDLIDLKKKLTKLK